MADVMAGNTQICLGSLIQMIPHVNSGRLRMLGIGSAKRSKAFPDVPTIAEAGVPGYDASNCGHPRACRHVAGDREAAERRDREDHGVGGHPEALRSQGAEAQSMAPAAFGKFIRTETAKWSRVVKEAGIKAD